MSQTEHEAAWPITLPGWVDATLQGHPGPHTDDDARMAVTIALSRGNLTSGDGGPFGAGIWNERTGELVAAGVNLVLSTNTAIAHAETVALTVAQHRTGLADLGERPELTLVASAEPCAMCLGAIPWSGIKRVVIGARDADIRDAGFDEGTKPAGWVESLSSRGIAVTRDVRRHEAADVLQAYASAGGVIYGS